MVEIILKLFQITHYVYILRCRTPKFSFQPRALERGYLPPLWFVSSISGHRRGNVIKDMLGVDVLLEVFNVFITKRYTLKQNLNSGCKGKSIFKITLYLLLKHNCLVKKRIWISGPLPIAIGDTKYVSGMWNVKFGAILDLGLNISLASGWTLGLHKSWVEYWAPIGLSVRVKVK